MSLPDPTTDGTLATAYGGEPFYQVAMGTTGDTGTLATVYGGEPVYAPGASSGGGSTGGQAARQYVIAT